MMEYYLWVTVTKSIPEDVLHYQAMCVYSETNVAYIQQMEEMYVS